MIFAKVFTPLLWIAYQLLVRLPFSVRRTIISQFVSLLFFFRRKKIRKNILLLRPKIDNYQVKQGIERLKLIATENYTVLLNGRTLDIEKEMIRLEVTGELEEILNLYRSGKKIVVVAPHIGPYDLGLLLFINYVSKKLAPVKMRAFILAESVPIIDTITNDLRGKAGDYILFGKIKRGEILDKAAHYLKNGYFVAFGFDMIRKNNRGVVCRIGDKTKAVFPAGWIALALREDTEDAIVAPIFPSSTTGKKILIYVGKPFIPTRTANKNRDIENNVRALVELYDFGESFDQWLQLPSSDLEEWDNNPDS